MYLTTLTFMGEVHEGWHKQFSMHHVINMFFSNINKQYGNLYVRKSMGLKLLLLLLMLMMMVVVVIWWELRFRIMWASAHAYDYIWIGYLLYERLFAFKYVGCHSYTLSSASSIIRKIEAKRHIKWVIFIWYLMWWYFFLH